MTKAVRTFKRIAPIEGRGFDGYAFTFRRAGEPMSLRFPSADLPPDEVARVRRAVEHFQARQFDSAWAVLEAAEWKPGRSGRPPRSHAWWTKLANATDEERARAEEERQDYGALTGSEERVRARVAQRLGLTAKTVSNAWGEARRCGWVLPLPAWKLRRVAGAYISGGVRAVGALSFVRGERPSRSAATWVELAREAGYLPPSK